MLDVIHYSVGFIYVEFNVLKSSQRIGTCYTDLNAFSSSFICYLKSGKCADLTPELLLWRIHLKSSVGSKFIRQNAGLKCFLHERP